MTTFWKVIIGGYILSETVKIVEGLKKQPITTAKSNSGAKKGPVYVNKYVNKTGDNEHPIFYTQDGKHPYDPLPSDMASKLTDATFPENTGIYHSLPKKDKPLSVKSPAPPMRWHFDPVPERKQAKLIASPFDVKHHYFNPLQMEQIMKYKYPTL